MADVPIVHSDVATMIEALVQTERDRHAAILWAVVALVKQWQRSPSPIERNCGGQLAAALANRLTDWYRVELCDDEDHGASKG